MRLSESESTTMLNPVSIDSAHKGRAPLLKQRDAILSARAPDLNARSTWADASREDANHRPCQGRFFSAGLLGRAAGRLTGTEGGGVSCGNVGDEGGDVDVGRRSAGINEEVAVVSDTCAVLEARMSEMLDFGGIGLNCKAKRTSHEAANSENARKRTLPRCKAARTFSQDGRATGETFKRLSSSTRYERGNRRDVKSVSRRGVLLNPGYNDTSRSSRSMSLPFPPSS